MQRFVNVRSTAQEVKPLETDLYHVYINNGIKEIHEEAASEEDPASGFDGWEIEEQLIYEKDEYIATLSQANSDLEETVNSILTEVIPSIMA